MPVSVIVGRGQNAYQLRELVKRRCPGYDDSEYLSELNSGYKEVWEGIQQLDENYFADFINLTTQIQTDTFYFFENLNGALNTTIPRLVQLHRIRVQFPTSSGNSGTWYPCWPRDINDRDVIAASQQTNPTAVTNPPVRYTPFGIAGIKLDRPVPVGTIFEVFYTFGMLDLQIVNDGTIASSGTAVTGTSSKFTQLVAPDVLTELPNSTSPKESQIQAELIVGGQVYRVTNIQDDTHLTTATAISPAASGAAYFLASMPELPAYEARVIADIATRNIFTTPADDPRFASWFKIAENAVQGMKNSLIARQRQEPPKRKRFNSRPFQRGSNVVG
jgi:hypothetical protein